MKNPISSVYGKIAKTREKARHDYYNVYRKTYKELKNISTLSEKNWKILDIGCGYHYPNVILFTNDGIDIEGIDILPKFYKDGLLKNSTGRKKNLIKKLYKNNKAILENILLYWPTFREYYHYLEYLSGRKINHENYKVRSYAGQKFPFPDGHFNIVLSNSVLEAVKDVSLFSSEIKRILNKEGIVSMSWKNYYSFSGNILDLKTNLKNPWGHLLGELKGGISLNRLRPEEIKNIFSKHFDKIALFYRDVNHNILKYYSNIDLKLCTEIPDLFEWEKEDLLFSRRKDLLLKYPKELLLSRGFKIICQN